MFAPAATTHPKHKALDTKPVAKAAAKAAAVAPKAAATKSTTTAAKKVAAAPAPKKAASGPWRAPNYIDSTQGDVASGENPVARQAAIDAIGRLNGSILISEAATGRVLAMVNQKVAFGSGFQPCSTIKVPVALAALRESLVDRDTKLRIYGNTKIAMTEALARSNNQYFASLGQKLGFERVRYYTKLFGLGEKAGWNIQREQPGVLPSAPPKNGGVGMMTSFGEGISLTPLEFAAIMGAVANGGTLYYMQYPRTQEEAAEIVPRVKRHLDISEAIPEIKPGMAGAVDYGTARRIGFDPSEPIYGKTGTCTDSRTPTHLGWFGSFNETAHGKLVVVVMLTGGSAVSGPTAAGVAGQVYKNLDASRFYSSWPPATPKPYAFLSPELLPNPALGIR